MRKGETLRKNHPLLCRLLREEGRTLIIVIVVVSIAVLAKKIM